MLFFIVFMFFVVFALIIAFKNRGNASDQTSQSTSNYLIQTNHNEDDVNTSLMSFGAFDNNLHNNTFIDSDISSGHQINPATGLPMISGDTSGIDVGGNTFGMNNDTFNDISSSSFLDYSTDHSWDTSSSFDSSFDNNSFNS